MQIVKDFWATPEYAELLDQMNQDLYPYVVNNQGTAKDALSHRGGPSHRGPDVRALLSSRVSRAEGVRVRRANSRSRSIPGRLRS